MKNRSVPFILLLKRIPLLRLLVPFVFGIILSIFNLSISINPFLISGITAILALPIIFNPVSRIFRWRFLGGIMINLFFFISGYNLVILKAENKRPDYFSDSHSKQFLVYLNDAPVVKDKSVKVIAIVQAIKIRNEWKKAEGKWLLYFEKDSISVQLKYGNCLVIKAPPSEIPPPKIPGEFDYKSFLAFRQVFYRAYVRSDQWKLVKGKGGNPIIAYSLNLREELVARLQSHLKTGQEFAVASALTVGYTDAIDPELMGAFSSSGTLHILSVSGMHVGIIYLMLAWILGFMQKNKFWKHLYFPLLIILIWSYSILSGCSPSVLRSAMMLSLVIVGKWISEKSPMLNTLAGSMFILLCTNPFMVTDVGFQLSYLAVLGIVVVHPMIVRQFELPAAWMHKLWELTAVSISAQLTTAPISLFYFHQFPNLFIPANIIIIPLSTLAIYGSIALMVFSDFTFLSDWLAFADSHLLSFINMLVLKIENFPAAVTSGINITIVECLLMYGILITGLNWLHSKTFSHLALTLTLMIILCVSQVVESLNQRNQHRIVHYPVGKNNAYGIIEGRKHLLLLDSIAANDSSLQKRYLQNFWNEKGVINIGTFILK